MRIRDTDRREHEWEQLKLATGENTKSGAIDAAVRYYLFMGRVDVSTRVGATSDLMKAAKNRGSLTAPEIAEIIDNEHLPVEASISYSVGKE
jgi:hypothetical protein